MAAPSARLLDLTRLVSRLGRGALTGVDRVELAYLEHLLAGDVPLFGLVRTAVGFVLLDRGGARLVRDLATGAAALGPGDLIGRLTRRNAPLRARAEATVRRVAQARCLRPGLARMLRARLPAGCHYLNVGHANLSARAMQALRAVPGLRIAVLVHDTIPLDHPEWARAGIPEVFRRKLSVVADHADLVIHSAAATRAATDAHLARLGRVPPGIIAPLGVPQPVPDPAALPEGINRDRPYFVTVGTIEPRKNHALLLDLWETMATRGPVPPLYIAGGRGWADAALLARLDRGVPGVRELSGLPDGALAALVAGARGLLFPSLAEGYGLPPLEAAALGTPVVCTPLAVFREMLGDYPVYLAPSDSYSWIETIGVLATAQGMGPRDGGRTVSPPSWRDHFNTVLSLI